MDVSDSLEDVDHSVLYYNQAVILYHLRQYKAATKVLDKLFQFIEPLGMCIYTQIENIYKARTSEISQRCLFEYPSQKFIFHDVLLHVYLKDKRGRW